jgi:OmpA-OmpF porin, OOP family
MTKQLHFRFIQSICLLLAISAPGFYMRSFAQKKNVLQLADEYFAAADYYTAATLYGQYLNSPKNYKAPTGFPLNKKGKSIKGTNKFTSRDDIRYKEAESYRLANYWLKAADLYQSCIQEKCIHYLDALYWYGVCQRSIGNYTNAGESFEKLLIEAGAGNSYHELAKKELRVLSGIRQELYRPDTVLFSIKKLTIENSSEKGAFAFTGVSGNQFLVSSTQPDSTRVTGVNNFHSHLFYGTLEGENLMDITPVALPASVNEENDGAGSISANGRYFYFSKWKKVNGKTLSSIYYSVKEENGWSQPKLLPLVNVNGYNSKQPFCSGDGHYLFFASDRPGGSGKGDIWYATLKNDGTCEPPVNAGTVINTNGDEQAPFYQVSSSTLVFSSNGIQGLGGYDLFTAKGNEMKWGSPENPGFPVNSPRDDVYFYTKENLPLLANAFVGSDRGSGCCLETYNIRKAPKKQTISGVVLDCKENKPLAGVAVTLAEASVVLQQKTTDINGRYSFDSLKDNNQNFSLTISRQLYKDTSYLLNVHDINESNLLVTQLLSDNVCMERMLVIKPENVVTIYFDFDRSDLKEIALNKLDSIYNVLAALPSATIQISGYTDGLGSNEYNKKLSDRRASACANYLLKKGIDASRISFESFGACCPVEMELINGRDNPDGRSRNRRALININKEN